MITSVAENKLKEKLIASGTIAYSGESYPKNVILVHDGTLGFNYLDQIVNEIGVDVGGRFTTILNIIAKTYCEPYLDVKYMILCRDQRFEIASVKIPFTVMTAAP